MTAKHCPSCRRSVPAGAFQCPRCELLLVDFEQELDFKPSRRNVVQAMFEKPGAESARPEGRRPPTRERPDRGPLAAADEVPKIVEGLRLSRMGLSRIEARVVGAVDGFQTVLELSETVGCSLSELQAVLQGLVELGVVTLSRARAPGEASAEDETVLLDLNALQETARLNKERAAQPRPRPPAHRPATAQQIEPERPAPARPMPKRNSIAPRGEGENALEMAIKLERSGRGLEALRYLELAISRSRDAAPLYNRLAIVLIRERLDFRGAEKTLLKALEIDPANPVYRGNLAMVRQRKAIATHPKLQVHKRSQDE
ncbi:MAG: hypothetical protein ACOX6T_05395 [Myxococcales bacterium]|jgi:type IV pilus assembly protein PilB